MDVVFLLSVILLLCCVQQVAGCLVSEWSNWSVCSERCGGSGISQRSRTIQSGLSTECPPLNETRSCNRFCYNNGILLSNRCICPTRGFQGVCCESDVVSMLKVYPIKAQRRSVSKDSCDDYVSLDSEQRSTSFISRKESVAVADDWHMLRRWYRFIGGAGDRMPTTCPKLRACGTLYPVWLNGSHPTTRNEEKLIEACIRTPDRCCANSWRITAKKCSKEGEDYFVYKLIATPGILMRYCAGNGSRCPTGETSPNGFTPGCNSNYPKLKKDPIVTVDLNNNRLRFRCKVESQDKQANVRHEVTWYTGPPEKRLDITKTVLTGSESETFLQNTNRYGGDPPTFCLGKNVYCKVASYYEDFVQDTGKFIRKSNEFFAGFEIHPKIIYAPEKGAPTKLTVTTTIPIGCQSHDAMNCRVQLTVRHPDNTDAYLGNCSLIFKAGEANQSQELMVIAKRDNVDDGDQTMFINFDISDLIDPVDWNCYENMQQIQVKVVTKDVKTGICQSIGEPRVITLDGTEYGLYKVGDYVMVESKARLFQVHARTWKCNSYSCNCGVAVREGDDVLVVDMCNDGVPRARFASNVEPRPGTTLQRDKDGNKFLLNFPSGAYVRFEANIGGRYTYLADIFVHLPSDDYENTTGLCAKFQVPPTHLCEEYLDTDRSHPQYNVKYPLENSPGTFDGDKSNDFTTKNGIVSNENHFENSWRIPPGESLFYYKGGARNCTAERVKYYCKCTEESDTNGKMKQNVNCNFEGYSDRPKYKQNSNTWTNFDFKGSEHCGRRRRRSLESDSIILPDDGDMGTYFYNPNNITEMNFTFPTAKGITEKQARSVCTSAVKTSASGRICLQTIPDFNATNLIEGCIFDVKALDDFTSATLSAVNSMVATCQEITLREIKKYWKNDTNGIMQPPSEIGNNICDNDCSGNNGNCINGTCVCNTGFISSDCSMKEGEPPIMKHVSYKGLCDIRKQDCVRTRVVGYNFYNSDKLKCRSTEVMISDNYQVNGTGLSYTRVSQLLSFAELSCLLPKTAVKIYGDHETSEGKPVGGFYLQLSNDGITFSYNKSLFLVYDSKCIECSTDMDAEKKTCKQKNNSCKINNYCFARDDSNPNDWCQVCDPSRSNNSFIKRQKNEPPRFKSSNSFLYAFKGQRWRFEISVSDPELKMLAYTFIGDSHTMEISSAGVVTWYPQEYNATYAFTVKATDPCGLSAQQMYIVKTSRCQCEGQNGGRCVWERNGNGTIQSVCQCPDGCTGLKCIDPIVGRICKIKPDDNESESDAKSTSHNTNILLAVLLSSVLVILLVVVGIVIYTMNKRRKTKKLTINARKNENGDMPLLPTTSDEIMETYVQTKMNTNYSIVSE